MREAKEIDLFSCNKGTDLNWNNRTSLNRGISNTYSDSSTKSADTDQNMKAFFDLIREQSDLFRKQTEDSNMNDDTVESPELLLDKKSLDEISKMSKEDSLAYLRAKGQEMREKLMNGETEEKIRIGGGEYTNSDWKKLIKQVDKIVDDVKKKQKEEIKERDQEKDRKDLLRKQIKNETMKLLEEEEVSEQKLLNLSL